jgi:ABC-type branched-subunit amino acid transport system substrate-binding protein
MINAQKFRWLRNAVLFLLPIFLILSFGCGPAPTPILIEIPTATALLSPTQSPTTEVEVVLTPEQNITITSTPFVPTAVVKIFSHVPLSGEQAAFGQDILRGTELAIQQLSAPLSQYNYQIELVSYDDQNTNQVALANAQQIASDPEILCGVGHYDSAITIAASNVYHLAGLTFVAPVTTATLLTDRNYLEANRLIARIDGQGEAAAQFAKEQGYGTVFIVSQQNEINIRNADSFRGISGSLGVQWLGTTITGFTPENINKIVTQIMTAKPDLVYISSSADQAIPFLTALRAAGFQGAFLGTEELNDPSLISQAGSSLIEGGGMFYTITNPPAQYYPAATKFVQDFTARYSTAPLDFAARAYDATGICLRAIEAATKVKGGTLPTRLEVARALRRINNYRGITGTYEYNRRGDPDGVQYYVYQVVSVDAANWDPNSIVATYIASHP